MQVTEKTEISDVHLGSHIQPIKTENINSYDFNANSNSKKTAFRKFVAECAVQPKAQIKQTLTEQFSVGLLQKQVQTKEIDPHTLIHQAILGAYLNKFLCGIVFRFSEEQHGSISRT